MMPDDPNSNLKKMDLVHSCSQLLILKRLKGGVIELRTSVLLPVKECRAVLIPLQRVPSSESNIWR